MRTFQTTVCKLILLPNEMHSHLCIATHTVEKNNHNETSVKTQLFLVDIN